MKSSYTIPLIGAGIGLMVLSVVIRLLWDKRRKEAVVKAGGSFGFHHLAKGEVLPIALVPLIDRLKRNYLVILRGTVNGYSAGFFDLLCGAGKSWFYQSAVIIINPEITLPKFQILTAQWSVILNQKTCENAVKIPGRDKEMGPLRLSADDPQWAEQVFSKAAPQFFQKLREGKWTIEGLHHSLAIYRWGQQVPARKLQEFVKEAADIAREFYSLV